MSTSLVRRKQANGGGLDHRVLLDASTRRFQAQKIYLRASAAHRWSQYRAALLQGGTLSEEHAIALQATDETLRAVSCL